MTHNPKTCFTSPDRASISRTFANRFAVPALVVLALTFLFTSNAAASKQAVDYFGTASGSGEHGGEFSFPAGIAVNQTGAGPADRGDIYVVDRRNNRIQRFAHDENGTPTERYDDTYSFVAAWGADVVSPGGVGDVGGEAAADYEVCTVASQCKVGVASAGNGSLTGDGALSAPRAVAIDQDSGDVYVYDLANNRTNVYTGDGVFLRSFGWGVVGSGPDNGVPKNEVQEVSVSATSGNFVLSYQFGVQNFGGTLPIAFNASAAAVEAAFEGSSFGPKFDPGDVSVSGPNGGPWTIEFTGTVADVNVPQPTVVNSTLTGGIGAAASTTQNGASYEICVAASGDVCEAGDGFGDLAGQINPGNNMQYESALAVSQPDGDPATGTVFLAAGGSRRINTYSLDGTSPASIGSPAEFAAEQPRALAIDSRGILYASNSKNGDQIERYDSQGANGPVGFLAPIAATGVNEVQQLTVAATSGSYRLSFGGYTTDDIPYNLKAKQGAVVNSSLEESLEALPSIGPNVEVTGGPGDATGSSPYVITFRNGFAATDVPQLTVVPGSTPLSGGAGASVATTTPGQPGLAPEQTNALAVDPDADGPGPDADVLYVLRQGAVQQFGPANPPGLAAPPSVYDAMHATTTSIGNPAGLAVDAADARIYAPSTEAAGQRAHGVYVLDNAGPAPTASLDSLSDPTCTTLTAHATVNPNGPPPLSYHFEYSTDGTNWTSTPTVLLGLQATPQSIDATIDPPGGGLAPNTSYQVRLSAAKKFATPVLTASKILPTAACAPEVETVGSPVRTTSTATLGGRVNPRSTATTYHFQYVTDSAYQATGFTDLTSGGETAPIPAGSDDLTHLASTRVENLAPATTYRYRIIADNGNPVGPTDGVSVALTTRATDAPLDHGHFPGPAGSDRAYEQVSIVDAGGNPVSTVTGISAAGDRALYAVAGGTPISDDGSIFNQLLAIRTETAPHQGGWQQSVAAPTLPTTDSTQWGFFPNPDLTQFIAYNQGTQWDLWRLPPGGPYTHLFDAGEFGGGADVGAVAGTVSASTDGSRVLTVPFAHGGTYDPTHPAPTGDQLYDVSTPGESHLISLLPDGTVPACGVSSNSGAFSHAAANWLTPNGDLVFFPSEGNGPCTPGGIKAQLYMRQIDAGITKQISGPPISGPSCGAYFIRSTPGAAYFLTQSRLDPADTNVAACSGPGGRDGDVYRYDFDVGTLRCITCVVAGLDADVYAPNEFVGSGSPGAPPQIGISADGSRLYFISSHRLLPGAAPRGIYRIDVSTGDLAYVAPAADLLTTVGDAGNQGSSALSHDGSVLLFRSADPALDPLGATADNAATEQLYRYDDSDRSLTCVSCPPDGSPPRGPAIDPNNVTGLATASVGGDALSADGSSLAFYSPSPLTNADQNTAAAGQDPSHGGDIYEWRDGRLLLASDGLSDWTSQTSVPALAGLSPSGRDLFFTAFARYTPDAPDAYRRLYDARIGGGFEFPPPHEPCALEVCQGTPKGAPEEQPPGTADFRGPGNPDSDRLKCPKGKVRRHGKCVERHAKAKRHPGNHRRAANHNRRTAR
jgi:hypothetical protein